MPLVFTATNTGGKPVTLHLMGRTPSADFRVFDESGAMIWSRLRGQTLLGVLRLFPIQPGKSLSLRQVWNQRTDTGSLVSCGEYLIRGVLLTDEPQGLASPEARIIIHE